MISNLDHLIIAVKNLDEAENNYQKIFGMPPVWRGEHENLGTKNIIFNFENTYCELLSPNGEGIGAELINDIINKKGEGLIGFAFGSDDIDKTSKILKEAGFNISGALNGTGISNETNKIRKWKNLFLPQELTRGIFSFIIQHLSGSIPKYQSYPKESIHKLDHVVINTNDADGFIDIYKDIFNIRLALDKVIEHWNSRMLFFRLNKTTIEVIEKKDEKKSSDNLWGLAWEVSSISDTHQRLIKEGVKISPINEGIKEGTLVATIKSHTHNVPTLLIQHQ